MKAEAGRKDRLPLLLATISVGIKRDRFSSTETGRCVDCLTAHLLQLSHYQTKKEARTRAKHFQMTNAVKRRRKKKSHLTG